MSDPLRKTNSRHPMLANLMAGGGPGRHRRTTHPAQQEASVAPAGHATEETTLPAYATAPAVHHGHSGRYSDFPQLRAALDILNRSGVQLAGFSATGHCVSEGAYLDPRCETGEVVLSRQRVHFDQTVPPQGAPGQEEVSLLRRIAIGLYASLFRAHGWNVQEFREGGQVARLILTPPAE